MLQINSDTLSLVKSFEGWRDTAYLDAVGVLTIGYGHTSMAGPPVVKAGMKITKAEGEALLLSDLQKYAKAIDDAVKVPLNANQFGALVSWCYNVGPGAAAKSSLIRKLNAGNYAAVPSELAKWNKAKGKVLAGLTRRRAAEAALFQKPVAASPAPAKPSPAPVSPKPVAPAPAAPKRSIWAVLASIIAKLFGRKG